MTAVGVPSSQLPSMLLPEAPPPGAFKQGSPESKTQRSDFSPTKKLLQADQKLHQAALQQIESLQKFNMLPNDNLSGERTKTDTDHN